MFRIECDAHNAHTFHDWIQKRGGVAKWLSVNLSNPGASWSSPAITNGEPTTKPSWESAAQPEFIVTDPAEIGVYTAKEIKRFKIAVRRSGNGMSLKLTDGSTNKVNKAVEETGPGAFYQFDYYSQEAIIYKQDELISLVEWATRSL